MVFGVKIQCRTNGQFYGQGGWSERLGKVWTKLGNAKLAICPQYYYSYKDRPKDFIKDYVRELNSDFLIVDDMKMIKQPVVTYFLDYFNREGTDAAKIVEEIKKYCQENNIDY